MPPEQPERIDIDLNILPPELRRRQIRSIFVLLWVLTGTLLVTLIASFILRQSSLGTTHTLQTAIAEAEQTSEALNTPPAELLALSQTLGDVDVDVNSLQTIVPTALAPHPDWSSVGAAIRQHDPNQLAITEILQDGSNLRVSGIAASRNTVLSYASWLEQSNSFDNVLIQSMVDLDQPFSPPTTQAQPDQTPAFAETPGAQPSGTPSVTRSPFDSYENDDYSPQPIAIQEPQWHSFNPIYDVDQVTFTGKAGRRYCILALPQSSGVDTTLLVTVNGASYGNDDCHPDTSSPIACACPTGSFTATRASLVEIQIPDSHDDQVNIRISNKGEYGPDQWYSLIVSESTGDLYEDDDVYAKPIAAGETQQRSFYPAGDIDRVSFSIKQGRAYEVRTTDLTLGIDTMLTVSASGSSWSNDDIAPGDRSSSVAFTAAIDGYASVMVTNKGQFGPNMNYNIQVLEVGGDAYEPDDYVPAPISPGEEQQHTFYPDGDIDRLEFNVKAGNGYVLSTYSLTVGVDTVVSVSYDGITFENDDATATGRESVVRFNASHDGTAIATISNRDRHGIDKAYWVTLTETGAQSTPGVPLYTPTPACADAYEPDDIIPMGILVNQTYEHTFCGDGDIDRAVFTAKAGYAYSIETTDLGAGVDTVITALIGQRESTNDDRGPQDLSSRLEIQNDSASDRPVYLTLTNQGYFGDNSTYTLLVSDAGIGDAYERDDEVPVSVSPGIVQTRTFYPPGDIDAVQFTAKSGHRYRIFTSSVSVPLDTEIAVTMGSVTLRNDDRIPGDLSSYLEIQNDEASDMQAVVTIFSKSGYDANASYTLQIDDLGTTGADAFEPDTETVRYLSVGEIQYHTFHPDQDIDRVFMHVKAGRRYAVYTCGNPYQSAGTPIPTTTPYSTTLDLCMPLVPGVDTVLRIEGQVQNCNPGGCTNDDVFPGTGFLNSRVEFEAVSDSLVTIYVENEGLYGVTREYYLLADEIGAVSTTPVPTPVAIWDKPDIKLCSIVSEHTEARPAKRQDGQTMNEGPAVAFTLLLELREMTP